MAEGDTTIDPAVAIWFGGAEQVNRGCGPFSAFIRGYTAEQYQLRNGGTASAEQIQNSSNDIARAVLQDIVDSGGKVPTLLDIGNQDVNGTATRYLAVTKPDGPETYCLPSWVRTISWRLYYLITALIRMI